MRFFSSCLMPVVATVVLLIGYPETASARTFDVTVGTGGNLVFTPSSVTIHPGDQVKWTWSSSGHSTTSGSPGMPNGIWDSTIRNEGATFTRTFNSVGTFPYDLYSAWWMLRDGRHCCSGCRAHSHADGNSAPNLHADGDAATHGYRNGDAKANRHANLYAAAHGDANTHSHPHANTYTCSSYRCRSRF